MKPWKVLNAVGSIVVVCDLKDAQMNVKQSNSENYDFRVWTEP